METTTRIRQNQYTKVLLLTFCCLFLNYHAISQKKNVMEVFISTSGDDNNDGTIETPFNSINKVIEVINANAGKKEINIYFREGTYYLSAPILHNSSTSGTEKYPIRYTTYKEEKVSLSSSVVLTNLKWEIYRGSIFRAKVEDELKIFDQLFVNGIKQNVARYPNFDPTVKNFNGYSAEAISPERVKTWNNPAKGVLHAMHRHDWGGYQYLISGKKSPTELILDGGFQNNRQMGMHKEYRMVENIFEELDTQNEWFYDAENKWLYFYPPNNLNLSEAIFEVPQLESIFELIGSRDKLVKHIIIEGFELKHTTYTFMKTKEPLLRSDWTIYRGGCVKLEGTEHCIIRDCFIHDVGGNAIFFSNYNRHNTIEKNHITTAAASGICFIGSPQAVRSPSFQYNQFVLYDQMDLKTGPLTDDYPMDCVVDNNLIHNIGTIEKQIAGVQISMAQRITVSRNSIYNLPRAGINISEGTWGGHLIEWNDVFNTVLETGDHGSFNSWGRDRYWAPKRAYMDSLLRVHPNLVMLDAIETSIIRNNRWRCDHGWDIDLDDGSSNYHIYNNLCLNGGLKLREGFNRVVENNIMVNNSFHPHVWFANSNDVFKHNIVSRKYYPIGIKYWGKEIDYNFFLENESLELSQKNGLDTHSLAGDPLFVNPDEADYRVKENSPAFEIGFKNFDMDKFGVQFPKLRSIAQQPEFPKLLYTSETRTDEVHSWQGIKLKTLTTEGERSATGINTIRGVFIVEVEKQSPLMAQGVKANTVIIACNGKVINNWSDFHGLITTLQKGARVTLLLFENQKERELSFIL